VKREDTLVESALGDYGAVSADASAPPTSRSNIKGTTKPITPKIVAVDSKMAVFFKNSLTDDRIVLALSFQPKLDQPTHG
jgi:hypothetical protein